MEIVICEEAKLTFRQAQSGTVTLDDGSTVRVIARVVEIPSTKVDQWLLDDFKSHGVITKLEVGDTIADFELCITGSVKKGESRGYIQLKGLDSFFYSALEGDPNWMNSLELQVTLTPLLREDKIKLDPVEASYSFKIGQPPILFLVSSPNTHVDDVWNYWKHHSWSTDVTVKIKCLPSIKQKCNGLLLTDEVFADTTVIAANKAEIKFHRCFLAVQSPVFEKMFRAGMKEARTGILEIPDMSEESVRALKQFLYVGGSKEPEDNCDVCFDLFKAGHRYAITELEAAMEKIFLDMDVEWCSADVALRLFLFVKDLEFPNLKRKAIQVLKSKRMEMKQLPRYRDLFKEENANVAMELVDCFAQDFN